MRRRTMFGSLVVLAWFCEAGAVSGGLSSIELVWAWPDLSLFSLATVIDQWPEPRMRGSGFFSSRH